MIETLISEERATTTSFTTIPDFQAAKNYRSMGAKLEVVRHARLDAFFYSLQCYF